MWCSHKNLQRFWRAACGKSWLVKNSKLHTGSKVLASKMVKVVIIIKKTLLRPVSPHIPGTLCKVANLSFVLVFFSQPVFDALKQHVQSLFVGELVPVKDRCTLTEALVIAR